MRGATSWLYAVVLISMLLVPLAGAQGSPILNDAHKAAIQADQGGKAPFGTVTKVGETIAWYLHRDSGVAVTPQTPPPEGNAAVPPVAGAPDPLYYVDYERPVTALPAGTGTSRDITHANDHKVKVNQGAPSATQAIFTIPANLAPTEDTRVYGRIVGDIFATCTPTPGLVGSSTGGVATATFKLNLNVYVLDRQADGSWLTRDSVGGSNFPGITPHQTISMVGSGLNTGSSVSRFTGSATIGGDNALPDSRSGTANPQSENGLLLRTNATRLQFGFTPATDNPGSCIIHFDTVHFPSRIMVTTDSGRLASWIENTDGKPVGGVPDPTTTSSDRRRFQVQVMHASAWPKLNAYDNPAVTGPIGAQPGNYMFDFWDTSDSAAGTSAAPDYVGTTTNLQSWNTQLAQESTLDLRIRDVETLTNVHNGGATGFLRLDRQNFVIGDSVNRYQYNFSFPESLPRATYRTELFSSDTFGVAIGPEFKVGLKAFEMESDGPVTHEVNKKEETLFRIKVRNTGSADDTITIQATPPGGNWVAEVIGGRQFLTADGGEAEVLLRVVPPATAIAGDQRTIHVTASSGNFPSEVTPKSLDLTVKIVEALRREVKIATATSLVETEPARDVVVGGIRVINNGTQAEVITLTGTVPTTAVGWTANVQPPSALILAGSSHDFLLTIHSSATADDGDVVPITLRAQPISDATKTALAVITAEINARPGVTLAVLPSIASTTGQDAVARPRAEGAAFCINDDPLDPLIGCDTDVPDAREDQSILYRIAVRNTGVRPDTYSLFGQWVNEPVAATPSTDVNSDSSCDDDPSSFRPDFWRVRLDTSGLGTSISGEPTGNSLSQSFPSVTIPGRTTQYFYLQLGWVPPTGTCTESQAAVYRLRATSTLDAGVVRTIEVGAGLVNAGTPTRANDYPASLYDLELETDLSDPNVSDRVLPGEVATHRFRVRNLSNERSDVTVQVPASTNSDFTRQLRFVPTGTVPSNLACNSLDPVGQPARRFRCPNMGVLDEAVFDLNVTAAAGAPPLRTDAVDVAAFTEGRQDTLRFITETTGSFIFDAKPLDASRDVEVGKTSTLPFVVNNLGTSGDRYEIALLSGKSTYKPRLSMAAENFVPSGSDLAGYVTLQVPANATQNVNEVFRVQVRSLQSNVTKILDFTVKPVAAKSLSVEGVPVSSFVIPDAGVARPITVKVTNTATGAAGSSVTVSPQTANLPPGWSVTPASRIVNLAGNPATQETTFDVTAPANAVSTSRVVLTMRAVSGSVISENDLIMNLADTFGVHIDAVAGEDNATVIPGGEVIYRVNVANEGLGEDTFNFTAGPMPTGWTVAFVPAQLTLGPLEQKAIDVRVKAPLAASAKTIVPTIVFATSGGDQSKFDQLELRTTVGFHKIAMNVTSAVPKLAPEETASFVVTLTNNGTLPDQVRLNVAIPVATHAAASTLVFPATLVQVGPGETVDVPVTWTAKADALSGVRMLATVNATSTLDVTKPASSAVSSIAVDMLEFVAIDADLDGLKEYAVNRDGDAANGFEEFKETAQPGGRTAHVAAIEGFLSAAARSSKERTVALPDGNTTVVLDTAIDGDADSKRDFFLDWTGDEVPDAYLDPDASRVSAVKDLKDVNADSSPELLLEMTGDLLYDSLYDLRAGAFVPLLQRDVDSDGQVDYVVDANRNGRIDADEAILYVRTGRILTVLQVDVDGDGNKDAVYDTDGDDVPDFFIRPGEETPIDIVLEDVNGDGVADWTFDADGDGRREAYYDPATGQAAFIDGKTTFLDELQKYWYIGALFGLVLVLFAVLLIVTRR